MFYQPRANAPFDQYDLRLDGPIGVPGKINGTAGNDSLTGTSGDDLIRGLGGDDSLSGLEGNDTLIGGSGRDTLAPGSGDDEVDGGAGFDFLVLRNFSQGVHVSLALQGQVQDTGIGTLLATNIEGLVGTVHDDTLIGDDHGNTLDTENGGDDTIIGGDGDDFALVRDVNSVTVNGGEGEDTVLMLSNQGDRFSIDLNVKGAQDTGFGLMTFKQVENVSVGSLDVTDNTLIGDKNANILASGFADDHLIGGAGDDTLVGDGHIGFETNDDTAQLVIEYESDFGVDTLDGGSGDDTLAGGQWQDTLSGGGGHDTFLYLTIIDSSDDQFDLITDLSGKDIIDLSAVDADSDAAGNQDFHLVKTFTGNVGELMRNYDANADVTRFLMDVDGDGLADMEIDATGDHRAFHGFVL